ncbi:MAG: HAMP domain-containing protein [Ruthenibacterium sp.]|nr:HAMP domain-containing protein [Ruthenibacterium sp.]
MKHRFTIQMKVTLWFTLLMVLLAVVSLAFLFYVGDQTAQEDTRRQMTAMVEAAWPEIDFDDGRLDIDDDLEYFRNGVYLSIYDSGGIPLYGAVPREFDNSVAFADGQLRTLPGTQGRWYVYDAQRTVAGYGTVWVRSVAAANQVDSTILTLLRLALVVLPFFVLLAAVGGYVLARRAFRPVRRITQTAREISEGNDLSRRIALGEGRDEVYTLAWPQNLTGCLPVWKRPLKRKNSLPPTPRTSCAPPRPSLSLSVNMPWPTPKRWTRQRPRWPVCWARQKKWRGCCLSC